VQQMGLTLTQRQGGEALEICLTHILSKISESRVQASKNENAG